MPVQADVVWGLGAEAWLVVATFVLAGVTGGLALIALSQLRELRRATQLQPTIDLLREYRSPEMRMARYRIRHKIRDYDSAGGMDALGIGTELREDVERVAHYLDSLGLVVNHKVLESKAAAWFLGGSALQMWHLIGPFIVQEREFRDQTYQRGFEDLAARFDKMDLAARIDKLGRLQPDPGTPTRASPSRSTRR